MNSGSVKQLWGSWVARYRRDHAGEEPALSGNERERLRQLEREARELRMENEFLKKVAMTARPRRCSGLGCSVRVEDRTGLEL